MFKIPNAVPRTCGRVTFLRATGDGRARVFSKRSQSWKTVGSTHSAEMVARSSSYRKKIQGSKNTSDLVVHVAALEQAYIV